MMRILGVDYGRKRVGLALSDPTLLIASPFGTIENKGIAKTVSALAAIIKQNDVGVVVIGLPLHASGGESEMSREVRAYGAALESAVVAVDAVGASSAVGSGGSSSAVGAAGVTVEYADERYSSSTAEDLIKGSFTAAKRGNNFRVRKTLSNSVDKVAASVILQLYLDERRKHK